MVKAWVVVLLGSAAITAQAQQGSGSSISSTPTLLTIYNQDFAVARATVDLNLKPGLNEVTTTEVTSQLEPDSVVLRDPSEKRTIQVGEQNYDAGVVTQDWLLQKYEGKSIDFQAGSAEKPQIVQGRVIRATDPPLIEVNGRMQFQLPGVPLFPATTDGLLLKPTLRWQIYSDKADHFPAELDYITRGMGWEATYNVVAPESTDVTGTEKADFVGWVTIRNQSGTEFPAAKIKLMAGNVAKLAPQAEDRVRVFTAAVANFAPAPQVTQQAFDDFHLYDLNRTVMLRNGETKQVEFLRAAQVPLKRIYEYDGSGMGRIGIYPGYFNIDAGFGASGNTAVRIVQSIKNSEANHLGVPLPAGRIRFYRHDTGGQMEFVGESRIDHTPAEDTIKVTTGDAFDVKGERKQTDFHVDQRAHVINESFEITLRNQKAQPVNVTVVEHMNRSMNWDVTGKSSNFEKRDSQTVEFPVTVASKGEAKLTYTVHYTW